MFSVLPAGKPELIINLYKQHRLYEQALRISEQHATHLISTVRREMSMLNSLSTPPQRPATGESDESFQPLRRERSAMNGEEPAKLSCEQIQERIELAQKRSNKEEEAKYALMLSAKHLSMSNYTKALNVINRFNVLLVLPETRKLVLRISSKLFAMDDISPDNADITWKLLRDTLFNVFTAKTADDRSASEELERHLIVAHYLCLKSCLSAQLGATSGSTVSSIASSLAELNLKLSIALLRYSDLVRVDYLFCEAGELCRQANRTSLAFIFLNHFLDLVDAIDEQDANLVDYGNLEHTDIPSEVPLPRTVFLFQGDPAAGEKRIEQIKSWILEKSMDNNEISAINGGANQSVYEASLLREDGGRAQPCLVTAYPVLESERFELKPGKYAANSSDWNQLIMIIKVRTLNLFPFLFNYFLLDIHSLNFIHAFGFDLCVCMSDYCLLNLQRERESLDARLCLQI